MTNMRSMAGMPATKRTCIICSTSFYGRADARYCSRTCRQKAYHDRIRYRLRHTTDNSHTTGNFPETRPVPVGDDWMAGRHFTTRNLDGDGYRTRAEWLAAAEAMPVDGDGWSASKRRTATRKRDEAIANAHPGADRDARDALDIYVRQVACLRRRIWDDDGDNLIEADEPLGDALPTVITPELANDLANELDATMPRLVELLGLLRRRAGEC
jgi:hypothetical protein